MKSTDLKVPLVFAFLCFQVLVLRGQTASPRQMMDPKAAPGIEVATIKPSNPDKSADGFRVNQIGVNPGGTITVENATLSYLVTFAYDLHPKQIIRAPAWINTDKFDITAKPDQPGFPRVRQLQSVLQKLLGQRFGLVFHNEKKELSAYIIPSRRAARRSGRKKTPRFRLPVSVGLRAASWFAMQPWPNSSALSCCRSWISQ